MHSWGVDLINTLKWRFGASKIGLPTLQTPVVFTSDHSKAVLVLFGLCVALLLPATWLISCFVLFAVFSGSYLALQLPCGGGGSWLISVSLLCGLWISALVSLLFLLVALLGCDCGSSWTSSIQLYSHCIRIELFHYLIAREFSLTYQHAHHKLWFW